MAADSAVGTDLDRSNPFAAPSSLPLKAPAFDKITNAHFLPAFEAGMAQQLAEVELIADSADPATFENTLTALELSGQLLGRVSAVFFNLTIANTDPELQKIQSTVAPQLANHSDNIRLNAKLFARIDQLYQQRDQLGLSGEQLRLLEKQHEQFVRAGARLDADQQVRIRQINERLSTLQTEFQNNLLGITKEIAVVVDSEEQLDGLTAGEIAAAKAAAEARDLPGKFVISITNTTRQPALASLTDRPLRQLIWERSAYRGLGRDGQTDNRPLVLEIAKLRAEKAQLLGFDTHASLALDNQMAKTPQAAQAMLTDLVEAVVAKVGVEAADIARMMQADGIEGPPQPWDWEYYAEKVRQERYDIDEAQVRPYFELESVLQNGVFYTMQQLYGITFRERHDLPVYHPDVRVFDCLEEDGTLIGLFYADYFARDNKRGGAWMSSFVDQSHLLGERPVIVNVMNIPKPVEGQPALMSFDQVSTMFHELGHGLHGMFSDVYFPTLSGTSVPRDFVEFPSTVKEDWTIYPQVLKNYARHHETGEPMPVELVDRLVAAKNFNQGFDTLEYLSAAILDLAWHQLGVDDVPDDMEAFEAQTLKAFGVDVPQVPPRYRTAYFAHIWPGGYSASYYAYMWSEVLAADAFAYLRDGDGLSRAGGDKFRQGILSRGGSVEPMQMFIDYRGAAPTVDALLIRRGLKD